MKAGFRALTLPTARLLAQSSLKGASRTQCQPLFNFCTQAKRALRYSSEHEWISPPNADGVASVGISDHAAETLGEIIFAELPDVDQEFEANDVFGTIESVKAASDLYSPVSGTVVEVNDKLSDNPGLVNASPEVDGWIMKIKVSNPSELDDLMDKEAYDRYVEELD
jgi:glycine cleavage system H protein